MLSIYFVLAVSQRAKRVAIIFIVFIKRFLVQKPSYGISAMDVMFFGPTYLLTFKSTL